MIRSFKEQLLGFLDRPSAGIPEQPLTLPAAWGAADLADDTSWRFSLDDDRIAALGYAVDKLMADRVPLEQVDADSVIVPGLSESVDAWLAQIRNGYGFAVVRGLPVRQWGEEKSAYAFWIIGHYLGIPGAQNPEHELLGHVKDYDEYATNPNVRRYRTAGNIDFHCDPADVVGLLCLHQAKEGGQSRIASSAAIVNRLIEEPDSDYRRLFASVPFDRRDEQAEGEPGFLEFQPCCYGDGAVRTFYHSEYFRSAARHFEPPELAPDLLHVLDRFDDLANSPAFRFDMWLEPGDMQFLSNHVIVHARTAYVDWPEPARRRHLLRLWLSFR